MITLIDKVKSHVDQLVARLRKEKLEKGMEFIKQHHDTIHISRVCPKAYNICYCKDRCNDE